jgi:hypothetical protein
MPVGTLRFDRGRWSSPFPALDPERTLVIAFGAPDDADSTLRLLNSQPMTPTRIWEA